MMKRKAFWALLAAGMTVVSTGVVSAQRIDRETLTRMISGAAGSRVAKSPPVGPLAAAPRAGMHGVNSLVGSWLETVTFESGRPPLTGLVTFHDDGTWRRTIKVTSQSTHPRYSAPEPALGRNWTGVGSPTRNSS